MNQADQPTLARLGQRLAQGTRIEDVACLDCEQNQ